VGALRKAGIEADYYDGTVGFPGEDLKDTFYRRQLQRNGTVRYGASLARLADVIIKYDVIALSSIFTAQTRMHHQVISLAKLLEKRIIAGGVNARALRKQFFEWGVDHVVIGDGEQDIVDIVDGRPLRVQLPLNLQPDPDMSALPLDHYQTLGIPHAGVMPSGTRFGAIQTSRGCQDQCSFCHISVEKMNGEGNLRAFSLERVSRDIDNAQRLGIKRLYFEDDNLFFNKRRLYQLHPILKRDGLEYSNVNGGNLRFLFNKGRVDTEFIAMLADFGLKELVLPFESRSTTIMEKYATGKYNTDVFDSVALVKALKAAGIRIAGNFMIGFPDEQWESVLRTKDFAKELLDAGLDAVGFMIPVPYPGSLDWVRVMQDSATRARFEADPLSFTDRMHWRAKPLFQTLVPSEQLEAAVQEFWEELNPSDYVSQKREQTLQ
jgi:radical SAM superfamily enzyme YgiQ (UPF0313 family)